MNDATFNALICLLEDDDPRVFSEIQSALMAFGTEGVPRLEKAWEQYDNPVIQTRLEEIIQSIQSQDTLNLLDQWIAEPNDLLMGWFLVSKYHFYDLQFSAFRNEINRLVNKAWLEMRDAANNTDKLFAINRLFYNIEHYTSANHDTRHVNHLFLNTFMERKKGHPLALGILYLIICQKLEIPVYGIILPGYFTLLFKDRHQEFFIDVFNKGNFFLLKDLHEFLKKTNNPPGKFKLQVSSPIQILLELTEGIIVYYQSEQELEKAARFQIVSNLFKEALEE